MSSREDQGPDQQIKKIVIEQKAGFLVLRLKSGEGIMICDRIEIRLTGVGKGEPKQAEIAVRAPKEYAIRRLK